ncbi:hypothetical protein [Kitasatospora sp. NPDC050543]|uniref:hypothetical protein n=1 Tax=Kitasatospora sp. NPDC050543 TaxID=3364054 RepID=UPI0037AEEA6D
MPDTATPATPEAICVGESTAVLPPDRPGPLDGVDGFRAAVGGAQSYVACGLAAPGGRAGRLSRVGDDGFGRRLTGEPAGRGDHRPAGRGSDGVGRHAGDGGRHHLPGAARPRPRSAREGERARETLRPREREDDTAHRAAAPRRTALGAR